MVDSGLEVRRLAVSVEEAAGAIGVGRTEMFRLIRTDDIHSFKVGKRRLVPVRALEEWVARKQSEAAA